MKQDDRIEQTARSRIRSLRNARGWTIDELARRAHIGPSTISRLETGHRRLTLDHLVTLARALDTTIDELLVDDESGDDVVIRPTKGSAHGLTFWMLNRPDDASGRIVAKMRVPASKRLPEPRVHPGRDWFYVLEGTVRLVLGDREQFVEVGQAAEFDTMTPHRMVGHGGPAEVLTIFDRHGERAHLHPH
ncbi:MAG TPA: helix-turn-helix transcriptional regulator [Microthrixaceae bacterium]|nr:helix-turn-helix transcriptional regulator [Microthrixaceae bacterium]